MPDFAVSTAFNSSGNILNNIGAMDKGVKRFGDNATKSFRKASRGASSFGNIVKGILAADVLKAGFRGLSNGIRATTTEFINYDQAIVSASAKFKGLDTTTAAGQKTLDNLKNTARELGATTEFSATQAAGGLDFLATAGFTAEQAIITLPGVVDLATVANVDLARATDIASDSLGAFGLMTDDTAQLQKNFTRVNDVMAKTMTSSNTSIEDLFESIKKGGSQFANSGQRMETFTALAGVMANAGLKGAESGTSLRNMMLSLSKVTPAAAKVMRNLGIVVKDKATGNFRDAIDILGDFETGLKGMGEVQRSAALATVFGARTVNGINILLQEGTDSLRDYRNGIIASGDASKDTAAKMRQSIGNQLASLKSAAIEVGFQFFDQFADKIPGAIASFTESLRGIDVPGIVENFKSLLDVAVDFRGVLFGMAAGWTAFKVAMIGASIASGITTFLAFAKAVQTAAAGQTLLNVAMAANPIGVVATAIGLLVGGLFLLVDNFDAVSKAFVSTMDFIARGVFGLIDAVLHPVTTLINGFESLVNFINGVDAKDLAATANKQAVLRDQLGRSALDGSFGADSGAAEAPVLVPPNQAQLAAQQVQFSGQLNISGAPEGSTFESQTTGAPAIRTELAGAN